MSGIYKADEAGRRARLKALETAQHHISRKYINRDSKMIAAEELLAYEVFTAAQITDWLGLNPWALENRVEGRITAWGVGGLKAHQIPDAIELAKSGIEGDKPKTMIFHSYTQGMSFDLIGGLLGIHKNVVRRIVRRIEGEPWT